MVTDWPLRLRIAAACGAWFWLVYGVSDLVTGWRAGQEALPSVALPMDAHVPFIPEAAWVYLSVSPALLLPVLLLDPRRLRVLARVFAGQVALAGLAYLVLPVAPTRTPEGDLPAAMRFADLVNLTYNSAPSLHVALSATCLLALWSRGAPLRNAGLVVWALAIAVSTLLTHQHFVVDVIAGAALAAAGLLAFRTASA